MAADSIVMGDVEIRAVSDAVVVHPMPLDRMYSQVPGEAWDSYLHWYPDAFAGPRTWHWNIGVYLIRSRDSTILVDTGLGPSDSPLATALQASGSLLEKLRAVGVPPESVDVVLLSHLHPDHVGWNLIKDRNEYRPTFPHARYVVHRADWETFHRLEMEGRGPFPYVNHTITPLASLGAVDQIGGDYRLAHGVTAIHTPGHTPGHMSVLIESGGEKVMLLNDAAFHPAQLAEPDWNTVFDMDPGTAAQTRHRLAERIEAEGMIVSASHFPGPWFGRAVRVEGRRYWQTL